jgi:cyclase
VIKKRLIGVVTVKDGWAVQSFGYGRYLPLGRPEILVDNLDRWGTDEILLQCIDRSTASAGPDMALLERIGRLGVSTPLIYAGGIRSAEQASDVVQAAADRICIDALLHDDPGAVARLSEHLGAQAVIAALPLAIERGALTWIDYRSRRQQPLSPAVLAMLADGTISEALVIDWRHEGQPEGFDLALLDAFPQAGVPLIAFGGLSDETLLNQALGHARVVAAGVGNFLSHREHAVQQLRAKLTGIPLRPAAYGRRISP